MGTSNGNGHSPHATPATHADLEWVAQLGTLTNPAFVEYLERDGGLASAKVVLEVGAGLGILTADVARRAPSTNVIGLELQESRLARARQLQGDARPANMELVQGDGAALPFGRDTFDLVYCRHLLEHLENPARVLSEMRRVLRPEGRICVQESDWTLVRFDPPTPWWDHVWAQWIELQATMFDRDPRVGRKLFGLLRRAGFVSIALSTAPEQHAPGSAGFASWIKLLLGIVGDASDSLQRKTGVSAVELQHALGELRALSGRDDASAGFHWNRACARKTRKL